MKKAFTAIGYPSENMVTQISSALANIGQHIGNLRNDISPTSHGKSLEELKERNNKVDALTREFLIDSTVVVVVLLIRAFENENPRIKPAALKAKQLYPEFEMGSYSFPAGEILFKVKV